MTTQIPIKIDMNDCTLEGIVEDKDNFLYIEMNKPYSSPWAYKEKEEGIEYFSDERLTPDGLEITTKILERLYNGCEFIKNNYEDIKEKYTVYFKENLDNTKFNDLITDNELEIKEMELRFLMKTNLMNNSEFSKTIKNLKELNEVYREVKYKTIGNMVDYIREHYGRKVNMGVEITLNVFNLDEIALSEIRKYK